MRYLLSIATAIALLWGGAVNAQGIEGIKLPIQATTKSGGTTTACHSANDMEKLTRYAVEHDTAAFFQYMLESLHDGECVHLDENQSVFIEKFDNNDTRVVCVRPKTEMDCLWTSTGNLNIPPKTNQKPVADDNQQTDFGLTPTDFLTAINTVGLKVKVRIIDQTSETADYSIGPCVVVEGELDDHQLLDSVRIAPTADDNSGCDADDMGMRTLVAVTTAEVMKVLTDAPDLKKNVETLLTLKQNLKAVGSSGLSSSEMKVGQRTVQMLVTLGGSRVEFAIYPE